VVHKDLQKIYFINNNNSNNVISKNTLKNNSTVSQERDTTDITFTFTHPPKIQDFKQFLNFTNTNPLRIPK